MKSLSKKIGLITEFILLFFGIPVVLLLQKKILHPASLLLPVLIALVLYFRKQENFNPKEFISIKVSKKTWINQILILILTGLLLIGYVFLFEPENLFNLPKGNVVIWLGMLIFYPVFSAYGQEIVFRKFIFTRYRSAFPKKWMIIMASATSFSFVHIVYFSVLSLVLTFFAGIYLAITYEKTKSVLFVSILHGIAGWLIFTVGLGQHFWVDMMDWIN